MKKLILCLLALTLCLSLFACSSDKADGKTTESTTQETTTETTTQETSAEPVSEPPVETYALGESVSTDLYALTFDYAEAAIALGNTWNDSYLTPKEYDAEDDNDNPYVASMGHTLVYFRFTVTNLDRTSASLYISSLVTVEYEGETYTPTTNVKAEGTKDEYGLIDWASSGSINLLLDGNEELTCKAYLDLPVDADLNGTYTLTVSLPCSDGSTQDFSFVSDAEGRANAIALMDAAEQEAQARYDAAMEEKLSEIDPSVADEIEDILQGTWTYTEYLSSGSVYYELTFSGNNVTVDSRVNGYSLSNSGTYSVRRDYILIEYQNGNRAVMSYTYENGNLNLDAGLIGID